MANSKSSSVIPAIRPQQFENDEIGRLAKSVNMFRGDVNFQKSFVKLPGKPNDRELDVDLSVRCQSNVHDAVTTWNIDAPTGVLGLGWILPLVRIEMTTAGSLSTSAVRYVLNDGESQNELIPVSSKWLRAQLPANLKSELNNGAVKPSVIDAFAKQGLPLGKSTTVTVVKADQQWRLTDDDYGRVYDLELVQDAIPVFDGGQAFELRNYAFYKICYYGPDYERWEVTTDSGLVNVYGGTKGNLDGNSIDWGVKWGGQSGNWTGPSISTATQAHYARAWYLSAKRDRWGDEVIYRYNEFPPKNGLIENVEQGVGENGLPYTKAVYLTSITDVFKRKVTLAYGHKTYTTSVQEYQDPHKVLEPASSPETPPSNLFAPNAYQDRYETLYLQNISVANGNGQPLYSLDCQHEMFVGIGSTASDPQPHLAKRLLSNITESNPAGQSLPGFQFDYYLDESDGPNIGALKSVTYPNGGAGVYSYSRSALAICSRSLKVNSPQALGGNSSPQVWFGNDFVVSTWLSENAGMLALSIYTWTGLWQSWTPGDDNNPIIYSDSPSPISRDQPLQVVTSDVSVALSFENEAGESQIYLFNRDPKRPDRWQSLSNQGKDFISVKGPVELYAGRSFILARVEAPDGTFSLLRFTYDWTKPLNDRWMEEVIKEPNLFYVLAGDEFYVTATPSKGFLDIQINYLECRNKQWKSGGSKSIDEVPLSNKLTWAIGPASLAITFATSDTGHNNYDVYIEQWDLNYQFINEYHGRNLEGQFANPDSEAWPPQPRIVNDGFVGVSQNAFRFDGKQWTTQSFEVISYELTNGFLAFAYGDDFVVQVANDTQTPDTKLLPYDANTGAFLNSPIEITTSLPPNGNPADQGYPSASGEDFFIARNAVFFRGSVTNWNSSVQKPVFSLPSQAMGEAVSSKAFINEAPAFLSYLAADAQDGANNQVQLLVLKNGGVQTPPAPLPHTSYNTNGNLGEAPAGLNAFVTYPANQEQSFSQTQEFTIYRYAGNAIEGPIVHHPVSNLEISDGFGQQRSTAYAFNGATAACDPTGRVVKYIRSSAFDGASDSAKSQFGRTVYTYLNGAAAEFDNLMLDGLLRQKAVFAGRARFATKYSTDLGLPADPGKPIAVPTALAAVFKTHEIELSANATIELLCVDEIYSYWDVNDPQNGSRFNIDYNGDPQDVVGLAIYDGMLVQSSSSEWKVFDTRNSNPTQPDPQPLQLCGGYSRKTSTVETHDGVSMTKTFEYLPSGFTASFNGRIASQAFGFTNGGNELEKHLVKKTYATELIGKPNVGNIYQQMLFANMLTSVVSTQKTIQQGSNEVATSASTANTWNLHTQQSSPAITMPAPSTEWSWRGAPAGSDDTGIFPFGNDPLATLWVRHSLALARSDAGVVLESLDAQGLRHSTLYDQPGQVALALLSNGSFVEGHAFVAGFEPFEDQSCWKFAGGAKVEAGYVHTGTQSLHLAASGSSAVRAPLTPDPAVKLVLGFWYKTQSGFVSSSDAGWTVEIKQKGQTVGKPIDVLFRDTGGGWEFVSTGIDMPQIVKDPNAGAVTLDLSATNGTSTNVWIDHVRLVPLACAFTGRTYDPVFRLPIDHLSRGAVVSSKIRDEFMRESGGTGPTSNAESVVSHYYSRQVNENFSGDDPNAMTSVKAFDGGSMHDFRDIDAWKADWTASSANGWQAKQRVLAHASTSESDTLTSTHASLTNNYSLSFDVRAVPGAAKPNFNAALTIHLGTTVKVTFTPATSSSEKPKWSITTGNSNQPPAVNVDGPPRSCLLIAVGETIAFFVNGGLLFSASISNPGGPSIESGTNAFALANLTLLTGASVKLDFMDATGAKRQEHVLPETKYLVEQTVTDARGKPIVHTKRAPGSFGSGAKIPTLKYRSTFVDVPDLLTSLDGNGVMKGDVADYYNGTVGPTNDEGYPYKRKRLEPSPLARTIEEGDAGKRFAIIDPLTSSSKDRTTVQYEYGNNQSGSLPPGLNLQEHSFRVEKRIDPKKNSRTTVRDATHEVVAKFSPNSGSFAINTTTENYTNSVKTSAVTMPNSFVDSSCKPDQVMRTYNPLAQLLTESSNDTGLTRFLYDQSGRVRFVQDAGAARDGIVTYLIYDPLGRVISRGVFPFDWNSSTQSQIQKWADRPDWPEVQQAPDDGAATVEFTIQRSWAFDGDGNDSNRLGQLISTSSSNALDTQSVTINEQFEYDAAQRLQKRQIGISTGSKDMGPYVFQYGYNNLGKLSQLHYPPESGQGLNPVCYQYDGFDKIVSIQDSQSKAFVTFHYNAMLHADHVLFGVDQQQANLNFDPLGQLLSFEVGDGATQGFNSTLTYADDGSIQTQSDELKLSGGSDSSSFTFQRDQLDRLTAAKDKDHPDRNLELGYKAEAEKQFIDQNGNFRTLASGDNSPGVLNYDPSGNRLTSFAPSGQQPIGYKYRNNGSLLSRAGNENVHSVSLNYVPGMTLPSSITNEDTKTKISLAYNADGQRVYKQVKGDATSSRIYLQAGARDPLMTIDFDGKDNERVTSYVYGPTGLLSIVRGSDRFSVIKDHLGSTRAILNASGAPVAAYSYLPFGGMAWQSGAETDGIPYLFTGQEYDVEVGLYNYKARVYDPVIGRFLAADPAWQYASPYLYVGDHPALLLDPTGEMSAAGEAGIDLGLLALIGLSVVLPGIAEAVFGASIAVTTLSWTVSGAISGLASQGLEYDLRHPAGSWKSHDFDTALWTGAVSGAASGLVSGVAVASAAKITATELESLTDSYNQLSEQALEAIKNDTQGPLDEDWDANRKSRALYAWKSAFLPRLAGYTVGGAAQGSVRQVLTNLVEPDSKGSVLKAGLEGALFGLGEGAASGVGNVMNFTDQLSDGIVSGFGALTLGQKALCVLIASPFVGAASYIAWWQLRETHSTLGPYGTNPKKNQ